MHFTRVTDLLLAGVIGLGAGYLLFEVASSQIPRLPTAAGLPLAVLALIEGILARWVKSRITRRQVTQPIVVVRCVVLAKASSLLGAVMLGGWLGAYFYLAGRSSVVADAEVPAALIGAACAAALIGTALWLEHSCRTPDQRDAERDDRTTSS